MSNVMIRKVTIIDYMHNNRIIEVKLYVLGILVYTHKYRKFAKSYSTASAIDAKSEDKADN